LSRDRSPYSSHILALAALTAVGAALRIVGLDSGLWYDEIVTLVESVRQPASSIVTQFQGTNNHPLYSLLAHASVSVFGEQAWSLRLPALLFGVASIPMMFRFGEAFGSRFEALLSSLLLAVSYHHIWFSQNARGYTALLFWTMLTTWLFLRILDHRRTSLAVAYGAAAALGVYTHLTLAFIVVSHALLWAAWLWSRRKESGWQRDAATVATAVGLAGIGSGLLYAPVLAQAIQVFQTPSAGAVRVATPGWALLETLRGLRVGLGGAGLIAAGALALAGWLNYWRSRAFLAAVFVLPVAVTAAGILASGSPIRPRFFFGLLGFVLVLVVRGSMTTANALVARARRGGSDLAGAALVGVLVLFSLASLPYGYRYPKQDFDAAVRFVGERRLGGEPVGTGGLASYPLSQYYRLPWPRVSNVEELQALREPDRRLWFVYSFPEYMNGNLVAAAEECALEAVLPGTVGGGAIIIRTCSGGRVRR
jgi:4-amino-4-deoxy-L-arabinose transferase-like glycosyltransferase